MCMSVKVRHMAISSFFVTFDPRLWPSSSVMVTFIFIIWWTLYCCVLVPSTKFVGSIEFEIWTIVWRKLKWRHYMTSSPISILWNLNTNQPRVYLSDVLNFILIKHKISEIQSREVNRELWRKNGCYVTVTLTFDPVSQCSKQPFSENRVKIGSSVRLEFCSQEIIGHTDTQTDTQTNCSKNITPPRVRWGVINIYLIYTGL